MSDTPDLYTPTDEEVRGWPDNDDTFTEQPRLWHVQYADESRDCDGIYPLAEFYVWARCRDDAENRAEEDFDTNGGASVSGPYDTRPATDAEAALWLAGALPDFLTRIRAEAQAEQREADAAIAEHPAWHPLGRLNDVEHATVVRVAAAIRGGKS